MTDAAVRQAMEQQIAAMYPDVPAADRRVVKFTRTRWDMNPWTEGSYSFYKVGSSPADRRALHGSPRPGCGSAWRSAE